MNQLLFDWAKDAAQIEAFIRLLRGGFDLDQDIRFNTCHTDREELIGYPPPQTCRDFT